MKRVDNRAGTAKKKIKKKQRGNAERFKIILTMVKLGFTNISPMDKVLKTRRIIRKMNGNIHFLDPIPLLLSVKEAGDELENAQKNMNGSKTATLVRDARNAELDVLMQRL